MRLPRSQGLQGSALLSRHRALWPGGDFSFDVLVGGVGLCAKVAHAGEASVVWVPSDRRSVALDG